MAKKSFAVSLVILVVVAALMVTMSQAASVNTGSVGNLKEFTKRSENSSEMTLEEATKTCNQSFEIKMDYLQELNRTGSFPDESDVHSLCYIKCYLEKIGVMSDEGDVNEERALQVLPDATKDMVVDCTEEMDKGSDICEKAYYIMRCIMTRVLVDGRSKD